MTHRTPTPAAGAWTRVCRSAAVVIVVSLSAGIGAASAAEATEAEPGPAASWVTRPVDPQPVVAGHEGDVLLEVNVVMAGSAAPAKPRPKAGKAKHRR